MRKSNKCASKHLLKSILHDTRSTTGSNLRSILLKTDKHSVSDLDPANALQVKYHSIYSEEKWRIPFIQDIIETKNGQVDMMKISESDLEDMLDVLCAFLLSISLSPLPSSLWVLSVAGSGSECSHKK